MGAGVHKDEKVFVCGWYYLQHTQCIGARHRFTVPHKEAAVASSPGQQLFGQHPADVPVIPPCCCHDNHEH